MNERDELARGVSALGLALPNGALQKLLDHLDLIEKWNRVYNLTAVRDRSRMLTHHVLDCLAIIPHVTGRRIADVGSGAGFPGIPLAIAWPESQVTLIESSHKKASFLRQAAVELALPNIMIAAQRVESAVPDRGYDLVITRAFSDLGEFAALAGHLCARSGTLAAMKGVYPHEELAQLPGGVRLHRVVPIAVPGLRGERHLVLMDLS
jgi:16S rRNA (guanine527-N7)-methyltransferase